MQPDSIVHRAAHIFGTEYNCIFLAATCRVFIISTTLMPTVTAQAQLNGKEEEKEGKGRDKSCQEAKTGAPWFEKTSLRLGGKSLRRRNREGL
ncbi:hypothetical protein P691DRAFT_760259 [Macrolepiota fuliginosa MF-IS2]|uniref:Uncharacterized protein n=1 Tax=Macrolepiota fuliginosa MF-IS2 TaxID=1400762 RepID=A0A9P5XD12_9AGAR|nr:hypothetical protein P691DRAFT_760259 [Macrolepiota fuliginosa MF-IS2]